MEIVGTEELQKGSYAAAQLNVPAELQIACFKICFSQTKKKKKDSMELRQKGYQITISANTHDTPLFTSRLTIPP